MTSPLPALRDYGLAAFIGSAGAMHFVNAEFFESMVPEWFPVEKGTTVALSGLAEITAGALVAVPCTRRLGGWAAFAVFVAVYPANIDAALNGGYESADPPMDSASIAWARLPLQFLMLWWAYKVATSGAAGDNAAK